jgi:Retinoic acid induced 16-like protein/Family of unknown function (DUF5917)
LVQTDANAAESIRTNLQKLTTTLQDEARSPHPHTCLTYVAQANIYQTVGRIGAVIHDEGVIRETVGFFAALVDSEDEEFLRNVRFSKALMSFVDRTCGSGNLFVGADTECEIMELLFGITAKIRLEPEMLKVWFNTTPKPTQKQEQRRDKQKAFIGLTSKEDFPLCYQLIDHVHHDGRIGDFARTGLLYIFETASRSVELERWIVDSDLPTLMASGLGALYSQLSRKLSIVHPRTDLPVVLQLSDYWDLEAPLEAESLFSDHLQTHLETFLSYLTFWQDVLEHCMSMEVKQTLLDHFQILFLQQLLYPSILESSDVDGGSSVAVLTYMKSILEALDHADFVHLILQYLLALPEPSGGIEASVVSLHAVKKRKSLLLLSQFSKPDEETSPALFNLADLIQSSIRSSNPQTVIAAFKLLSVILHKDHPYAVGTIIRSDRLSPESPQRTHGALNAEVEAYLTLARDMAGEVGMDDAYEGYLRDCQRHIELHCCSTALLTLESLGIPIPPNAFEMPTLNTTPDLPAHIIQEGDVFFSQVLALTESFLTNNVEVNLSLTEVLLTLAACPKLRLEDWLAVNPHQYRFPATAEPTSDDALVRLEHARRKPTWSSQHSPQLLKIFESVKTEIELLKQTVPSLHQLINTRKQAFRLYDEISEAMEKPPPTVSSSPRTDTGQPFGTPQRLNTAASRLLDRTASPSGRSQSPRGRSTKNDAEATTSSPSPSKGNRSLLTSPFRKPVETRPVFVGHTPEDLLGDIIEGANSEVLARKIEFPLRAAGAAAEAAGPDTPEPQRTDAPGTTKTIVSLSHVLSNIVILQEFMLELVAVMQIRASLFQEVQFA